MIRAEHDGNSTNEDLLDFYAQLPNGDRQFVILPHTAHSIGYSNNRHLLWYAVRNFLQAPAAVGGLGAAVRARQPRLSAALVIGTLAILETPRYAPLLRTRRASTARADGARAGLR